MVISNTEFKQSTLSFQPIAKLEIEGKIITLGGLMTPETLNSSEANQIIHKIGLDIAETKFGQSPPDILLSHLGSVTDKELPYATCVVGGHTHDRQLGTTNNGHLMVNTGVGECIVVIRPGTNPQILLSDNFSPSQTIQELINQYSSQYNLELGRPVFSIAPDSILPSGLELSAEELKNSQSHLRVSDSMMMRLTADAIWTFLYEKDKTIDFVLYPAAAIRSNFLPGQKVTEKQLFETYYYNNKLVKICLSGSEIIHLLAIGVMQGYKCWENRGQLLTPSEGLTYAYDVMQKNPGDTILWVKVNDKYIDPNASFHIVTTDWVAKEVKKLNLAVQMEEYPDIEEYKIFKMVICYLQNKENLSEKFGERISPAQDLQQQNELITKHGYRRADPPNFD